MTDAEKKALEEKDPKDLTDDEKEALKELLKKKDPKTPEE